MEADAQGHVAPDRKPSRFQSNIPAASRVLAVKKGVAPHHTALTFAPRE